jgi:Bcr/CflA subfamily drug resistance transporter
MSARDDGLDAPSQGRAEAPPHLITLVLASALSVVTLNFFLPALSDIARDFGVDYALVTLAVAGYMAISAVLQLIVGPLSDRYGRRPVMLVGLSIFALASLGCALAPDIWTFLAFRMLQGGVVVGYTVSLAIVRDIAAPNRAASLIGYLTAAWALAPMLGPVAGGALADIFGWRATFWAFLGAGLAVGLLCWRDLGETNHTKSASLTAQIKLYPQLLSAPRFWGYVLCTAFSTGAFFAYLGGAPFVASAVFGLSAANLGIAIGVITGGYVCGNFLSGRLAARYRLTTMMIAGRVVACAGLGGGLILLALGIQDPISYFGSCVFVGLGNGLTMPSSNAGALSVREGVTGSAAGLMAAITLASGAVISGVTGALVTPETGAWTLLGVMLISSALGLGAALFVRGREAAT